MRLDLMGGRIGLGIACSRVDLGLPYRGNGPYVIVVGHCGTVKTVI